MNGRSERTVQRSARPPETANAAAGAYRRSIGTMVFVRSLRKRRWNGLSSNDESGLARLSARSNGLDDVDGSPDCGSYIQMRGIEQVCILRLF